MELYHQPESPRLGAVIRGRGLSADVAGSFWTILDFSIVFHSPRKSLNVSDFSIFFLVLPDRIELSTSPLPRECSTTELRQQNHDTAERLAGTEAGETCHKGSWGARIPVATPSNAASASSRTWQKCCGRAGDERASRLRRPGRGGYHEP